MKVVVLGVVPPKADRSASGPDATPALPPGPCLDPEPLSEHLALLGDGATVRASVIGSGQPFNATWAIATLLLDADLPVTRRAATVGSRVLFLVVAPGRRFDLALRDEALVAPKKSSALMQSRPSDAASSAASLQMATQFRRRPTRGLLGYEGLREVVGGVQAAGARGEAPSRSARSGYGKWICQRPSGRAARGSKAAVAALAIYWAW